MRLEVLAFGELGALGALERLQGIAIAPRLGGAEAVDREHEAVTLVLRDLRIGQLLAHGDAPAGLARPVARLENCAWPGQAGPVRRGVTPPPPLTGISGGGGRGTSLDRERVLGDSQTAGVKRPSDQPCTPCEAGPVAG